MNGATTVLSPRNYRTDISAIGHHDDDAVANQPVRYLRYDSVKYEEFSWRLATMCLFLSTTTTDGGSERDERGFGVRVHWQSDEIFYHYHYGDGFTGSPREVNCNLFSVPSSLSLSMGQPTSFAPLDQASSKRPN